MNDITTIADNGNGDSELDSSFVARIKSNKEKFEQIAKYFDGDNASDGVRRAASVGLLIFEKSPKEFHDILISKSY